MNDRALREQAGRALEAERRAREAPQDSRFKNRTAASGETACVFRNSGAIESLGGRSTGGRPIRG